MLLYALAGPHIVLMGSIHKRQDMKRLYPANFFRLSRIFTVLCLAVCFYMTADAKKIYPALYGRVYLNSGDSIIADGNLCVGLQKKKKELRIISDAYTGNNRIIRTIEPETVDSLIVWSKTAPDHPHKFRFIKEYGWCFEAEHSPYISVCCYAPKGYRCGGNGGLWMYGKCKMLVIKDGKIYEFGQPDKKVDKKMLTQLESLVADDPALSIYISKAKGRRDKILRSLVNYNPEKL